MSRKKIITEFLPETKRCFKCGKVKNKNKYNLQPNTSDGLAIQCEKCRKQQQRESDLHSDFKITEAQYKLMLKSQNNVCKICKQSEIRKQNNKIKQLCVDHNHKTGKIRGLLCSKCNMLLGRFENKPGLLEAITKYLEENK